MSGHAASLQDSCVPPGMVATISDQLQGEVRRNMTPEISRADVEAVLNTVIALESGQGPKPATNTADYYGQIARFSGRSYYVVSQVVPAYIATLSGTVSGTEAKNGPTETKDSPSETGSSNTSSNTSGASATTKGNKSGLMFAIGGLFGLIALIAFVAKRSQR